jgi:hypothetical protein
VDLTLVTRQIYDFFLTLFLFAPVIGVFLAGARWGRRVSAIALVICLIGAAITVYSTSTATEASTVRGYLGFLFVFGALASIGPLAFTRWPLAMMLSVAAEALFIVSGLPLLFACGLFGACSAYP